MAAYCLLVLFDVLSFVYFYRMYFLQKRNSKKLGRNRFFSRMIEAEALPGNFYNEYFEVDRHLFGHL